MKNSELFKEIEKAENIALICHKSPDGDAFGSMTALYKALKNINKDVLMFCEDPFNRKLSFIPNAEFIKVDIIDKKFDLAIVLDCASYQRMGIMTKIFDNSKISIQIDHHITNDKYAKYNYISPQSAATCEYLYQILKEFAEKYDCLDKEIGTSLYCGIITDSGDFQNNNTTKLTKIIANEITEKFLIDSKEIVMHFMKYTNIDVFNLKIRVLSKVTYNDEKTVGLIYFSLDDFEKTNTSSSDTEGIINEVLNINGIRIAAAVTQISEEKYKVSLRSKTQYPIDGLANQKGGGGHHNAAGYSINGYELDVLEEVLRDCTLYAE